MKKEMRRLELNEKLQCFDRAGQNSVQSLRNKHGTLCNRSHSSQEQNARRDLVRPVPYCENVLALPSTSVIITQSRQADPNGS